MHLHLHLHLNLNKLEHNVIYLLMTMKGDHSKNAHSIEAPLPIALHTGDSLSSILSVAHCHSLALITYTRVVDLLTVS